jgi:phosphoglycerate dehydrogenase-like enzyme
MRRKINVLNAYPFFGEMQLDTIRNAVPQVTVDSFAYGETEEERSARRKGEINSLDLHTRELSPQFIEKLAKAEVMFILDAPTNFVRYAPKLKWVQLIGAGVDHLKGTGLFESNVDIVSTRASRLVAEHAVALVLLLAKQLSQYHELGKARRWERLFGQTLWGNTIGIVGLGHIGSELARLCNAFEMRVLATHLRWQVPAKVHVDGVFPPEKLKEMLGQCDYVVLCVALTPQTENMFGEAELRSMKPEAFLVNVSRGEILREDALIQALREGWIAGAALDVFRTEPLNQDSELWNLPNLFITPHVAGSVVNYFDVVLAQFCENLRRYVVGKPPLNVIDKKRGY